MEYFENELCVTYEELTSGDDPIISGATLRQNIKRGILDVPNVAVAKAPTH